MSNLVLSVIGFKSNKESINKAVGAMTTESLCSKKNMFDLNMLKKIPSDISPINKIYWVESVIYYLSERLTKTINQNDFNLYLGRCFIDLDDALVKTKCMINDYYLKGKLKLDSRNFNTIEALLPPNDLEALYLSGKSIVYLKNNYGVLNMDDWMKTYWESQSNSMNTRLIGNKLYMTHKCDAPLDLIKEFSFKFGLDITLTSLHLSSGDLKVSLINHGAMSTNIDSEDKDKCLNELIAYSNGNLMEAHGHGLSFFKYLGAGHFTDLLLHCKDYIIYSFEQGLMKLRQ